MADFRCGPARDLPIKDGVAYERDSSRGRMLDAANIGGDNADYAKARRGFLIYDAAAPELRGSYHLPFADIVDGTLTAIGNGVRNAASRLPQMNGLSDELRTKARGVLDVYMAKLHADGKEAEVTQQNEPDSHDEWRRANSDDQTVHRAYAILNVKELNEEQRVIRGTATTPSPDRVGDVVEPMGITFRNPMPFLWQHRSDSPIGLVNFDPPTTRGIKFEAHLPKVTEPGALKDRVDEAWQSVKYGLVAGASIGFRSLPKGYELMADGGIRYKSIEALEVSLVTIPANQDCTVSLIKSLDRAPAASGRMEIPFVRLIPPGVSGKQNPKTLPRRGEDMKTIAEQITALEATRAAKSARQQEVMQKSIDEGRSTDAAEREEFDTLEQEVDAIDGDLKRLRSLEKSTAATAKPVGEIKNVLEASQTRAGVVVKNTPKLEPGIEFARYAMCVAAGKGNLVQSFEIAKNRYPDNDDIISVLKTAVDAGTTTDPTWALPLVQTYQRFAGDFVEFLRPRTIIGQFGTGNIPSLRRVPFNIQIVGQTSGGSGYWVGEGAPKPLTKFDFSAVNLRWAKVANIAVLTEELIRFSNPSAEVLVRESLAAALIERLDIDFVDPNKAAVANVSPASITRGVVPIPSSGNDAAAVRADIRAIMATYIAANITPTSGVWIMSATTALALSLMMNDLGSAREFPNIEMTGGILNGLPVIVSEYTPTDTNGSMVILVNASDIWLADDGQVMIDASREASLQMLDNPTNNSGTGTATSMVSLWQTNSIGLRAERVINWQKRRAEAAAVLDGVSWGQATGVS